MNQYNYSSYCQRPDEVDLGVYQLSPVQSPTTAAREQHFLQELRNLRTGVGNGSYRDIPIALSPSFIPVAEQAPPPNVHSLHRTFSDSNVILQPPQYTLRCRDPPSWMANPPPPFSRPAEGYNSLDRNLEQSRGAERPGFFKCASPTPWQSSDNLVRESLERAPLQQRQSFFSPAPRQENRWEPEKTHWQREPEEEVRTSSRWDSLPNVQEQQREYARYKNEPEPRRNWEQEVFPEHRQLRASDWEQPKRHQQQQVRPRDLSLSSRLETRSSASNGNWTNSMPKVECNRDPRQRNSWDDQDVQQRQQVQRDLLQEIREHRQQEAARQQQENQFRNQDVSWRQQPSTPLTPLFENRTSRRGEWEQSRGRESEWEQKSQPRQRESSLNRNSDWERPYGVRNEPDSYQNDWNQHPTRYQPDPMTRSQNYGREGFFTQPIIQSRAMTEPPTRVLGMLDKAMQNREQEPYALGPELEMDVTVTHSSYRNGEGRTVATSPQRHSYAGTFSELSRNQKPSSHSQESRPRSLAHENSSLASSPAISPPNEFSLPTSPIQRPVSLRYPTTTKTGVPIWELDTIYGLNGGQRSYRNGEQAQRSTVTTPMYGRGTLNERQSVERTTAVVNPLVVEQPKPQTISTKHSGILLNPNEGRKSAGSKRRVMFRDEEEQDDFYGRSFAETADAPVHVKSYDVAIEDQVSRFVSLSDQIGGDVAVMVTKFTQALDLHRHFLWQAASQPKPLDEAFQKLFQPLLDAAEDISKFKDSKRQSPHFNHLNVISEGIPALGWVTIPKTPAPYIQNALEASMFYLNRILKEYKDKDQKHVDWVKTFQEFMKELQTFVRQTHTTGLVWNSAPGHSPAPMPVKSSAPSAGPFGAGGPPPPPPPPPMNLFDDLPKTATPSSDKAGRDALFVQLNQGANITSGLKKVTADMQTHKNPNLRSTSTVPSGSNTSVASSVSSPSRAALQKPPRIELENGKQWAVEFHNGNKSVVVEITDKKQSVYVYKCDNCVVQVKGKCNSVALDGCKKTAIVVDGVVAQIETVNCQSVQIQTMGDMPTLSIQKTDGCQVYLSEASKDCEIVTSKSSEMNVLVPDGKDGDFIELALPEQFKTVYKGGKLVTTVSDI